MNIINKILSTNPKIEIIGCNNNAHFFHNHIHESFTLGIVLNGKKLIKINETEYVVNSGECFIINPYEPHSCSSYTEQGVDYIALSVPNSLVFTSVNKNSAEEICFNINVGRDDFLFNFILDYSKCLNIESNILTRIETLENLFPYLFKKYGKNKLYSKSEKYKKQVVVKILDYFDIHYSETIQSPDLVNVVHISPFHLNRIFREIVGVPPHQYLQLLRLRKAKELLRNGESIVASVYKTGFSDQSHLTRVFKKNMGITPGKFIKCE